MKEAIEIIDKYIFPISILNNIINIINIFTYIFRNNKNNNKEDNMIQE